LPSSEAPTSSSPTSDHPTSDLPSSEAPSSSSPTSDHPTSDLPSSEAPSSSSPTSDHPTSDLPSSEAPSSNIPISEPPTTEKPTPHLNRAPVITSPRSNSRRVGIGKRASFSIHATDPEGDPIFMKLRRKFSFKSFDLKVHESGRGRLFFKGRTKPGKYKVAVRVHDGVTSVYFRATVTVFCVSRPGASCRKNKCCQGLTCRTKRRSSGKVVSKKCVKCIARNLRCDNASNNRKCCGRLQCLGPPNKIRRCRLPS